MFLCVAVCCLGGRVYNPTHFHLSISYSWMVSGTVCSRVAVCSSMLQCIAVYCIVLQCVAVCCSVLQCVAVCCSVLQCVAVPQEQSCRHQLQYQTNHRPIAVCCSLLQCVAWMVSGTVVPGKTRLQMVIATEIIILNNCSRSLSKGFTWKTDVRILRFRFWFPFQGPFWVSSSRAWAVVVREWWEVLWLVVREWLMTCGCVVRGCRECLVNLLWCSWMVCGFWICGWWFVNVSLLLDVWFVALVNGFLNLLLVVRTWFVEFEFGVGGLWMG